MGAYGINLKNHGFVIVANNIIALEQFLEVSKFNYRTLFEKL